MSESREGVRGVYERMFRAPDVRSIDDEDVPLIHLLDAIRRTGTPQPRILDAGCGNGRYARALVERGYERLSAVDLFDGLADGHGFDYQRASVDQTPFADGSFDLVYSFSVIYYLDNPSTAMSEFYRLLSPGGHALISAHTRYSHHTLVRATKRQLGMASAQHLKGAQFISAARYTQLAQQTGFEVVRKDGYMLSGRIMPTAHAIRRRLLKATGVRMPLPGLPPIGGPALSSLRSELGYHSLLLLRRPA